MVGFKTRRSTYYVDQVNQLMWGGKLQGPPRRYITGSFILGDRGYAEFTDGTYIRTGTIIEYI